MEMPGIEPGAFHMQSERATTALHPLFDKHMLSLIQLATTALRASAARSGSKGDIIAIMYR